MTTQRKDWLWYFEGKLLGFWRMLSQGVLLLDGDGNPPNVPALNMVAPLEAAYNEPEGRFDLSISPLALIPSVPTNRTVWLDVVNGDDVTGEAGEQTLPFASMPAAITAVQGLTPTAASPALIKVHPGTVTTAPFTVPKYVTIASTDGAETAIIEASTATAALITLLPSTHIKGITIKGANGIGGIGVLINLAPTPPDTRPQIERCIIRDCTTGMLCTGSGSTAFVWSCEAKRSSGEVMDEAFKSAAGATLLGRQANAEGQPGVNVGKGFVATGSGSSLIISETFMVLCDSGLYAESGALLITSAAAMQLCGYSIHIDTSGGTIDCGPSSVQSSTIEDVYVESSSGVLSLNNVILEKPINVASGATVFGPRLDRTSQEVAIEGSVRVGDPLRPASACFGEGGLYQAGLRAFWNTNVEAGTWTDITDELLSPTGSIVDLVPGLGTANSCFIGSDVPLPGIWFDVAAAQSGGTISPKYWNGAAWTAIPRVMVTQAAAPYASRANTLFAVADQQNLRFSAMSGDTAKTLNGVLKYWYLFEVTSGLTSAPRIEQVRFHGAHVCIEGDGYIELFGAKQPRMVLPGGDMLPIDWHPSGVAPSSINIGVSTSIIYPSYGFIAGQDRQIHRALGVPHGLNTAEPVLLDLEWDPGTSTNTGSVRWVVSYATFASTAVLAGGLPGPISEASDVVLSPGPGVAYRGVVSAHTMFVPTALPGDTLAVRVQREGSGDTFIGTAGLRSIRIRGTYWALGAPSR